MKKALFILLFFLMTACVPMGGDVDVKPDILGGIGFNYTVVDGMPCITYDGYEQFAMTCDWSQWDGEVDGGEIILP